MVCARALVSYNKGKVKGRWRGARASIYFIIRSVAVNVATGRRRRHTSVACVALIIFTV